VVRAHGFTDKGRVRPINEDSLGIDDGLQLLIVADGMGGHNAGEVASRLAVDAVLEYVRQAFLERLPLEPDAAVWPFGFDDSLSFASNVLRTAVHLANVFILETAMTSSDLSGMGTTVVAALVRDGRLSVAHVGDSRLYLLAGNRLRLLTTDDSWMADRLANDPDADPIALQHHPMRNALTNVVGAEARTVVHVREEPLAGGEFLLLTTDGVHGVLDDRRIEEISNEGGRVEDIAASLVEAALARGSRDNCTALVAQYFP
jgi:serine/threonine protein phosphatase PrpC